jgi:DNA-binding NarL/FixJ family response regulator
MVTGMALDDSTIARVHEMGCMFMPKLSGTAWFAMFVEQARLAALARCDRRPSIDAFLQSCDLTARERDIFWLDMRGDSRAEIAAKLGITRETLKRHIRAVIRKCGPCKNMRRVFGSLLLRFCSPRVDD